MAKKEFKLPCRIGKPNDFYGLEDDLNFATCCGLIVKANGGITDGSAVPSGNWTGSSKNIGNKFKKLLKIFIP